MNVDSPPKKTLHLIKLGIDTYKAVIIYLHDECPVCKSEGFEAPSQIKVALSDDKFIIATLHIVKSKILDKKEAGLSEYGWKLLGAKEGDRVHLSHPAPLRSVHYIRGKIYGKPFSAEDIHEIIHDVSLGYLSDIHISAFLTICAGDRLCEREIINLTKAMVDTGAHIKWPDSLVVDKHCVGGLPGNRTTLIVVPIVAAFGLTIPKTSSRAITSAAGTADTMEVLAPIDLTFEQMKKVVTEQGGCIVWGGSVALSPADDVLIRVERVLDLDSFGQLVASVLSKKIAAGSDAVVIDIPIGKTAKVRIPPWAWQIS